MRVRAGRSAGFALPMPAGTASVKAECASALVDPDQLQTVCIVLPVISRLEMAAPKQPFTRRRRVERLDLLGRSAAAARSLYISCPPRLPVANSAT